MIVFKDNRSRIYCSNLGHFSYVREQKGAYIKARQHINIGDQL